MTTFHDPQPQSRRAVRQSERGESAESPVGFTEFPASPAPAAPQFYATPEASGDMWDTTARRAAQLPPVVPAPQAPPAAPVTGRRSAGAEQPAPAAEPLTYSTQSRVAPTASDALPPTQAIPRADQPAYRVRDFSPEGRRAAPVAAPTWNSPAPTAAPVDATPLEYQTQARVAEPVAPPAPVAQVPVELAVPELVVPEHTLTRRELRALQLSDEGVRPEAAPVAAFEALGLVEPVAAAPLATPVAEPAVAEPVSVAPIATDEPVATDEPAAWPFGNLAPAAPVVAAAAPIVVVEPALESAPAEPEQQRLVEDSPASVWTAPVGHWSTQAGLDDETQPYENTINRTVGSGSVTTNALVLPTIPEGSDIRGPLTHSGEILLTGSIDLPQSYASTGASARVEHHGIDALFDLHDAEVVTTDSQPVRAISAVSTHNSGQGVTHTQKPKGTRALTALVISAVSMAVVVVGLLVAVLVLNIF